MPQGGYYQGLLGAQGALADIEAKRLRGQITRKELEEFETNAPFRQALQQENLKEIQSRGPLRQIQGAEIGQRMRGNEMEMLGKAKELFTSVGDPQQLEQANAQFEQFTGRPSPYRGKPFTPDFRERVTNDLMTIEQRLKSQQLAQGKWQYDPERGGRVNVQTGQFEPVRQAGGQPLGPKEKPLTESQGTAAMYGSRMAISDRILSGLEKNISTTGLAFQQGLERTPLVGGVLGAASRGMLSPDQQRVEQAQRDFLNAILRKESGAVIGPTEFESGKKQYFPQPGDKPQVIEQKRVNRQTAIAIMRRMAGGAAADIDEAVKLAVTINQPATQERRTSDRRGQVNPQDIANELRRRGVIR